MDPLSMYLQDRNHQGMKQPIPNKASTMRFPLNTSPTHEMVQWSPNFEPIFVPIPLRYGSVPTTLEDENTHSFEFGKPNISTFNYSNIQQGTF